jgi:hypothetical protein
MRITENRSQVYNVLSCIEGCEHPLAALLQLRHIGLTCQKEKGGLERPPFDYYCSAIAGLRTIEFPDRAELEGTAIVLPLELPLSRCLRWEYRQA